MATSDRGLGSSNMSQADKDKIHSMGGKASSTSHSSTISRATATNKRGTTLTKEAQRKGGSHSHSS